jgi:hypothetical protein
LIAAASSAPIVHEYAKRASSCVNKTPSQSTGTSGRWPVGVGADHPDLPPPWAAMSGASRRNKAAPRAHPTVRRASDDQGSAIRTVLRVRIFQPVAQRLPVEPRWGVRVPTSRCSAAEWGDRASREARWRLRGDRFRRDPFMRQADLCTTVGTVNVRICRDPRHELSQISWRTSVAHRSSPGTWCFAVRRDPFCSGLGAERLEVAGRDHLRSCAGACGCEGGAGAGEDVEAEVAAAFGPFVVLLGEDGADEADQ